MFSDLDYTTVCQFQLIKPFATHQANLCMQQKKFHEKWPQNVYIGNNSYSKFLT